jgi:hypothetical protein
MSNHSSDNDPAMVAYLNEQFRKAMEPVRPGSTGQFPHGKLTPQDEGGIRFMVGSKDGVVIVDFGKPVAWLGMPPSDARALAESLVKHADAVERKK